MTPVLLSALLASPSALAQSAEAGEGEIKVERLLEAELDKSWADENGWTQLHWAAAADDGNAARRLLKLGMTASPAAKGDGSEFSGEGRRRVGLLGQDADTVGEYRRNAPACGGGFQCFRGRVHPNRQ